MVVGFAGSGNIAAAMARGWAAGEDGPERILFTDSGSGRAAALAEEVAGYPTPGHEHDPGFDRGASEMLGPVRLRAPDRGELSFFGMFATFDTPFEVTTSELAIELLFPADQRTAEALRKGAP